MKRIQLWNSPLAQQLYENLGSALERRSFIEYLLDNSFGEVELLELAIGWETERLPEESLVQYLERRRTTEMPASFTLRSTRLTPHLKRVRRGIARVRQRTLLSGIRSAS